MKLMLLMYFEFLISLYFWLTNLSCRREPLANQAVERNICSRSLQVRGKRLKADGIVRN